MIRSLRGLVLALLAASLPASAGAQNLLLNGNFNTSIASWDAQDTQFGTVAFSPLDAGGSSSSGSALVTNTSAAGGRNPGLEQCQPASPGVSYDFGAKARTALGQPAAIVYVIFAFHPNPTCSGAGIGSTRLDFTASGSWQGLSKTGVVAPAGTVAMVLVLAVFKSPPGGSVASNFDDAFIFVTNTQRGVLTIPVAASIHGANQTFFHSDAWIMNRSFSTVNVVTAVYRCFGGVGCGAPKLITLAPRESKLIADIVATLFGVPESGGAIELFWDTFNGPITAQTRLFTPASPPSYGFGVPALPANGTTTRAVFVGVAGSPDLTTGFRSNAGAYNPNAFPVTVTFTLTDGTTGAPIGSPFTRVWAGFEAAQVSNVVTTLGGTAATTNAVLVATSTNAAIFFYVATVDNASGDSIYVTASADEAPVP